LSAFLNKMRRLFRYRLRSLLLLPALFALGWWWVTWPERTARRFVAALAARDVETAQAMFSGPQSLALLLRNSMPPRAASRPQSWREIALAQREFDVEFEDSSFGRCTFVAARGRVSLGGQTMEYAVRNNSARAVAHTLSQVFPQIYGPEQRSLFLPDEQDKRVFATVFDDDAIGLGGKSTASGGILTGALQTGGSPAPRPSTTPEQKQTFVRILIESLLNEREASVVTH
jgi:hypothetical protein